MEQSTIINWLREENPQEYKRLFDQAYSIKSATVGNKVYFRGIIELSNICQKNCYYCGIRKDIKTNRYLMTMDEICDCADFASRNGYGSIVIQAGERQDKDYIRLIDSVIIRVKEAAHGALGITLSLGEQRKEVYKRWFNLGAHRYLLRIETSAKELYEKLHPHDHSFNKRLKCLYDLKEIGYQVGTGVIIGIPGQRIDNLYQDLLFFQRFDIDMIGMGPYIPHEKTPMNNVGVDIAQNLTLSLKMIALIRILMPDINIAATTALQAIDPFGREKALQVGANVIMPNITPQEYRLDYDLYDNKPCLSETPRECKRCLSARIEKIGETIGYNEWGDSPHFYKKL